jgi:putative transposase
MSNSTTLLTYEYRLYPRRAEVKHLEAMLEQGREVYNAALAECKAFVRNFVSAEANGKGIKALSQWDYFREWRKQEGTLLNASSLQHLLRRLDKAYSAFFRRCKAGAETKLCEQVRQTTPGHPRFKGKDRFNSLEYTYGDGCKLNYDNTHDVLNDVQPVTLYVQNVGDVKVKLHRLLPVGASIKHVILKRKASGWYVCLQLEVPEQDVQPSDKPAVAGDVGLLRLLTLSDGTEIDNPRWLRGSLAKLRRAQRRLSRRKKGSGRRKKARQQVALLHEHVANTRKDFWHKTTRTLGNTYGAIALEDLNLNFLLQNGHLSLSAHDAGLGMFYTLLDSKAANAGVQIVRVDPAYTSQVCSGCGVIVKKELSVRVHCCPHCDLTIDRDLNAARNIFALAFNPNGVWACARIERSGVNVVPLAVPSGAGKRKRSLRSLRL